MVDSVHVPPMRLSSWMERIEAVETPFLSVQGVADLAVAMTQPEALKRNTCYLAYASEAVMQGSNQAIPARQVEVAVVSALLNRTDRRGEAAISDLELARAALSRALLGWYPPGAAGAVSFRRGDVAAYSKRTLWWRDVYSVPAFAPVPVTDDPECPALNDVRVEIAAVSLDDVGPPDEEDNRLVWQLDVVSGNGN